MRQIYNKERYNTYYPILIILGPYIGSCPNPKDVFRQSEDTSEEVKEESYNTKYYRDLHKPNLACIKLSSVFIESYRNRVR